MADVDYKDRPRVLLAASFDLIVAACTPLHGRQFNVNMSRFSWPSLSDRCVGSIPA